MTTIQQKIFFDQFVSDQKRIMLSKGDDYANDDRLSNFKVAGAVAGGNAKTNCLNLIATKVARIGELIKGKSPKHESITDSLIDLGNYTILLAMIISEDNEGIGGLAD